MSAKILQGEVRSLLASLPAESVHCAVTSPPYYALRSYGTEPQVWGGAKGCNHRWQSERHYIASGGAAGSSREAFSEPGEKNAKRIRDARWREDETCSLCSAWRGELGLEPSVDLYVEHVVEVFAEVWRVLRKDGTCWLNVADSYHGGGNRQSAEDVRARGDDRTWRGKPFGTGGGLKPKDLCLVPQRLALALQAAGWWVRCDVIWSKPNPMPESLGGWSWQRCRVKVEDSGRVPEAHSTAAYGVGTPQSNGLTRAGREGRVPAAAEWAPCPGCPRCEPNGGLVLCRDSGRPTKAHEYLFLLARGPSYYWDAEAVKEQAAEPDRQRSDRIGGANGHTVRHSPGGMMGASSGRNLRSVWTINPQPFLGAHFATYPEELVRRCILASTSEAGCCPSCGAPYARVIEEGEPDRDWQRACGGDANGLYHGAAVKDYGSARAEDASSVKARILAGMRTRKTTGWRPTCACAAGDPQPCLILDPFTGSGTTGLVAKKHGRSFVGCELKEDYAAMAEDRIGERGQRSLFA